MDTEKTKAMAPVGETPPESIEREHPERAEAQSAPAGENRPSPEDPRKKRIAIGAAVAAVLVVACIGGIAALGLSIQRGEPEPPEHAPVEKAAEPAKAEEAGLSIRVNAEGWTDESTPVIAHVVSADGEVDFYTALPANAPVVVENDALEAGKAYEVSYISPIDSDGAIYRTPEKPANAEAFAIEAADDGAPANAETPSKEPEKPAAESDGDGAADADEPAEAPAAGESEDAKPEDIAAVIPDPVEADLERVPAEDVTQEDLDKVLDEIKDAVAKGDQTLSGDAAQAVIDKAAENASNNPNADAEKVEEKKEEARQEADKAPAQQPSSGGSASSGTATPPSSGGSNSSSGSGSASSTPAHAHTWVAQTSQQWVSNWVTVVDQAEWTEYKKHYYYACACGATFANSSEAGAHQHTAGWDQPHNCWEAYTTEQIYHPAVTHQEDQGYYQTVTTGYVCSGCGAAK